ncbi:MAG: AMP-binding protein [Thiolinea sp.]
MRQYAASTPDKPALIFQDQCLSYAQLLTTVEQTVTVFAELELKPGDRIVWYGMNHPEMLILLFAAAESGLILVPLNWRLALPELQQIVFDCQPAMIFHDQHFAAHIPSLRLASDQDCGSLPVQDSAEHDGHLPAFRRESGRRPILPDLALDRELMIVYTSGTTGRPKGAVLNHASFLCNARMSQHMHDLTAADHVLSFLPLFHVGGFNIQLLPALLQGATVTLLEKFDANTVLQQLDQQAITLAVVVPTILQALLNHPHWDTADLSSLRALAIGSTDVPVPLIEQTHARGFRCCRFMAPPKPARWRFISAVTMRSAASAPSANAAVNVPSGWCATGRTWRRVITVKSGCGCQSAEPLLE